MSLVRNQIPFSHEMFFRSFWESTIARWPRRTAEYKAAASLYGTPSERIGPMMTMSLRELQDLHAEIAAAEKTEEQVEAGTKRVWAGGGPTSVARSEQRTATLVCAMSAAVSMKSSRMIWLWCA